MEATSDFVDDHNDPAQEDQQSSQVEEMSNEELIAEVAQAIDYLFEPSALVNNSYLINRAVNENFEIPIKNIYFERSVKAKTNNRELINRALDKATNITVNKKGDIITSIMPKNNETKRKIVVKNIPKEKVGEFKHFVYGLDEFKEGALTWNFNYQLSMVSIICRDEEMAAHLYQLLTNNKFEDQALELSLENENLYISALEIQKKKFKNAYPNPMAQMYSYNNMLNPYQMYAMFTGQANNFYVTNYYPHMNQHYANPQTQPFIQPPMFNPNPTPNPTTFNKKPYNPNYKNGDKKFYSKRGKQPREKNYNRHSTNSRASTKSSSSIVVNENDFPPL